MFQLVFRFTKIAILGLVSALCLLPCSVSAQNPNDLALDFLAKAMDSYSNLDMEKCEANLEQARNMAASVDKPTLARVYTGYAVLRIGGLGETAEGQNDLVTALCLFPSVKVDPMYSTPDIDTIFTIAKQQAKADACDEVLSTIVLPAAEETEIFEEEIEQEIVPIADITPCGQHDSLSEQKSKFELPFFVVLSPQMIGKTDKLVVRYAYDASTDFRELVLQKRGNGFGAMLTCDEGNIRVFDPSTISYYIEGTDVIGQTVCGHGTLDAPIEVMMMPDATPMMSIAGMQPKECAPCAPWDDECHKRGSMLPKLGDSCTPDVGCAEDLRCGDLGICEMEEGGGKKGDSVGPSTFYVNVTAGTGFGYEKKSFEIHKINWDLDPREEVPDSVRGAIEKLPDPKAGTAWNGIPLRLAIGYQILPELSVEVSGRFDVWVTSSQEPISCWDAGGQSVEGMAEKTCNTEPTTEEEGKKAIAWSDRYLLEDSEGNPLPERDDTQDPVYSTEYQYAWMVNARARYRFATLGSSVFSAFGGIGYGFFQYRVPTKGSDTPYFPLIGKLDIEVGLGFAYYFNDHIGLLVELPIDFVLLDGFAINVDLTVGLGFGF